MKFDFTDKDLHNLYDLLYMLSDETFDTLKLNKLDKWLIDFQRRLERVVIPEIKINTKELLLNLKKDPEVKEDLKELK